MFCFFVFREVGFYSASFFWFIKYLYIYCTIINNKTQSMIKQSRRFIPFKYWDYKYNPITGFKTHRKNELVFNKERENR